MPQPNKLLLCHLLLLLDSAASATGLLSVPLVCFGQIPGPTIRAVQGPAADVTLKNSLLTEHVAIHWHGIREISTPLADATEGMMQCPPLPGDTFMVDRPGTYQAHNGVQGSVELNGTFAVSVPARDTAVPFAYNREHTDVHLARYGMQRTAGLSNMQRTMVVVSLPEAGACRGRGVSSRRGARRPRRLLVAHAGRRCCRLRPLVLCRRTGTASFEQWTRVFQLLKNLQRDMSWLFTAVGVRRGGRREGPYCHQPIRSQLWIALRSDRPIRHWQFADRPDHGRASCSR